MNDVTVDRLDWLSPAEFRETYLRARKPVVFGRAADDWPAMKEWSPAALTERWGHLRVDHRGITGSLAEILERAAASTPESPQPYLKNLDMAEKLPELLSAVQPRLAHADPNWFDSVALPSMIRSRGVACELFIGGNGSTIPRLHHDEYAVNNFITQIWGTKEFWFYPPGAGQFLYPDPENPYLSQVPDPRDPDLERFPRFLEIEPIKLTLFPGETVFVAPDWWHWTWMPELSISVGTNCSNNANWGQYVSEFTTAFGRRGRPKWVALSIYLSAYGAARRLTGS